VNEAEKILDQNVFAAIAQRPNHNLLRNLIQQQRERRDQKNALICFRQHRVPFPTEIGIANQSLLAVSTASSFSRAVQNHAGD
jgi:hypothetical protein